MRNFFIVRLGLLLGALLLLVPFGAYSQLTNAGDYEEEWRWVFFNTESGLPSNLAYSIVEAGDGIVWAATAGGLAWYDGFRWVPVGSEDGVPRERPSSIYPDDKDNIIATFNNGIFVGNRGGFKMVLTEDIHAAVPFSKDTLMVLSKGRLMIHREGTLQHFDNIPPEAIGKKADLWKSDAGNIWLQAANVLYCLEDGTWEKRIESQTGRITLVNRLVVENHQGDGVTVIVLPFDKRGIWTWKKNSKPVLDKQERLGPINTIAVSPSGKILMAHESGVIRSRVNGSWKSIRFAQPQIRDIEQLTFSSGGDLWVCTQKGIFLHRNITSPWKFIGHHLPDPRNNINEIVLAKDGNLWLATGDGIEIIDGAGKKTRITSINGNDLYAITGLAQDGLGRIWASSGSSFGGVYMYDGRTWTRFGEGTPFGSNRIHKIRRDRSGRPWFLGISDVSYLPGTKEPGAWVFDEKNFVSWGTKEGLPSGRVYAFAEGEDGALWFGTFEGVSRWKSGTWTHWREALPFSGIRRIFTLDIDGNQNVWFSNRRDGVGIITPDDSMKVLTDADGLVNNDVWDIRADNQHRIWITTEAGLSSYNLKSELWSSYDVNSGLRNPRLWPVLPTEKEVFIGTRGSGLAILDPAQARVPDPIIIMERPTVDGNAVEQRWKALAYWGNPSPQNILTRYRLNSEAWSSWSTTRRKAMKNLEPGEYTFEVQARGLFGHFDVQGDRNSFFVQTPLLEDPIFIAVVGMASLTLIVFVGVVIQRKQRFDADLARSEAQFRAVAETTGSAIFIFTDERFLFVNPGGEALTGYSLNELQELPFPQIVHPDFKQEYQLRMGKGLRSGTNIERFELRILTKAGEEKWLDYSEGDLVFQGIHARLGTASDITEKKRVELKVLENQVQLRSLASELSLTEERERRRMAAFLHDSIGQALALCKMKLGLFRSGRQAETSEPYLIEIRELLDQAISSTRSLTFDLSPPVLYELGLVAAIDWLVEHTLHQHNIKISFQDDGELKPLGEDLRSFLFEGLRELVFNIVKHADAKNIRIDTRREGEWVRVEIQDDGKGFDVVKLEEKNLDGGFGLFNIGERLSYLGGCLDVESEIRKGTKVTMVAPLETSKRTLHKEHYVWPKK